MIRSVTEAVESTAIGCMTNTQNARPSPVPTIAASTSPARLRPGRARISRINPTTTIGYPPMYNASAGDGYGSSCRTYL